MGFELEWCALACFRLWKDGHPQLVMDPYRPPVLGVGEDEPWLEADQLLLSSLTDRAHSYVPLVRGDPPVTDALAVARGEASLEINGEPVVAVEAAEAPEHPEGADPNAMYAFKVGDLWLLHFGDLGYGMSAEQLAPFEGKCDIMLAITGERLTVKLPALDEMIDILKPTWIIPMHYNVPPCDFGMTKVETFIARRRRDPVMFVRGHTIELPPPRLSDTRPTIVVMEPSGYEVTEPA